jgi:hypothetical protein
MEAVKIPTRKQVERLKKEWEWDPIWDLFDTDGFEHYKEELKEHQQKMQVFWYQEAEAKRQKKAEEMGVPADSPLFRYINLLEHRIEQLEKQVYGEPY